MAEPQAPGDVSKPRARVEVDLGALRDNFRSVAERAAPARLLPVLKADAYGHGAPQVAAALEPLDPAGFGVARVEEGVALRRAGIASRILVFAPLFAEDLGVMARERLTPVVSSLGQLQRLEEHAAASGWSPAVHLKVDTGMGRLGIGVAEAGTAIAALRRSSLLRWEGLLSHLGDADSGESPRNRQQEERFESVLARLDDAERARLEIHLANSAGALLRPASRYDLVRPGLALYGGSIPGADLPLRPVLSLRAPLLQVKTIEAGEAVGYGGRWRARHATEIGIVGVGYADGYPWRAGGHAEALVGGRRVPVIGAVSMDLLAVDLAGARAREGDEVVLIGRQGEEEIRVAELAERAGTIPYEILCQLRLRLPRVWTRERDRAPSASERRLEVAG